MREGAYLSTHQAAAALRVGHKQISALIRSGRLPATKLGRDWAIAAEDLDLVRQRPRGRPRKDPGPYAARGQTTVGEGQTHVPAAEREDGRVSVMTGGAGIIVAVFGRKGGSGKTTCAFNLAGALAALGWRCLLVDLDGQASLTRALQDEPVRPEMGIGSRIMQFDRGVDDTIRGVGERLDLIPGDQSINGAAIALAENPTGALRLGGLLRPLGGRYDAIILDTAPNLGFSQNSALLAADVGVMPTRVGAQQDIDALLDTLAQREEQARFGLRVARISCILPSSYEDQHAAQRMGLAALQERYGDLVGVPVPFSGLVERALNARVPLVAAYPRSTAALSFMALAERLAALRVAA
jgi:chromosome partitioning protein